MKNVLKVMAVLMAVALVACDPTSQNPPVEDEDLPAFLDGSKKSTMMVSMGGLVLSKDTTITVTEFEKDELASAGRENVATLRGKVQGVEGFRVSVHRSDAGLEDEFCAADNCRMGDGEVDQDFDFVLRGTDSADWYTHFYQPANGKAQNTYTYTFKNHDKAIKLTIKYEFAQ